MTVTGSTSAPSLSAAPTGSLTGGAGLGRDAFLQLLVAQLRNQDPTSPQDGHEFAAQLAQFSQVEQLTAINGAMSGQAAQLAALAGSVDGLQALQGDMAAQLSGRIDLGSAAGLIGKTVELGGWAVEHDGGAVDVPVRLGADAQEVEVVIRDERGAVVRTLRTGARAAGDHAVEWDGALEDGSEAPAGRYTAEVSAIGDRGAAVEATAVTTGTVERLSVEGDGVFLWVGGQRLPFGALLAVRPS